MPRFAVAIVPEVIDNRFVSFTLIRNRHHLDPTPAVGFVPVPDDERPGCFRIVRLVAFAVAVLIEPRDPAFYGFSITENAKQNQIITLIGTGSFDSGSGFW